MGSRINIFQLPVNAYDMDHTTSLKKLLSWGNGIINDHEEISGYVNIDKALQQLGAEYGRVSLVLKSRTSMPSPLPLSPPEFFMCDLEELLVWVKLYGSRLRRAAMSKPTARAYLKMTKDLEDTVEALSKNPDYRSGFMRVLVVVS
ncbi:hypothetical protein UFOVP435_65 [uncultured Caudovirales phage]|uniref:Uncharacterized protein n=1 Tax=uncultured Caudovirales phage TaxID=2100421 RepID=A0A6J5M8W4_9CAUD|nr:hypothetical protein UFOVP435_65 [uncultured Caudovirales phage]